MIEQNSTLDSNSNELKTTLIKVTFSTALLNLVSSQEANLSSNSLFFSGHSSVEIFREMRRDYPLLASKLLTETATLMLGFVLVLNDEVIPQERIQELKFRAGDEIYIIGQLSGG